jgi:hypothetical protein
MKRIFIVILLFPLIGLAQKTDFFGKWFLDKRKTDFKNVPEWVVPVSFDIKQRKDALVVQTKEYDKDGNQHYNEESISLDGKTNEVLLYNQSRKDVSMRLIENDSSRMLLTIHIISPENTVGITYTETWSIEDAGKTLVVDRVAPLADEYSIKTYYIKK